MGLLMDTIGTTFIWTQLIFEPPTALLNSVVSLFLFVGVLKSSPRRAEVWRSCISCLVKSPTTVGNLQSLSLCCSQPPALISQPLLPAVASMIQDSFGFMARPLWVHKNVIEKFHTELSNVRWLFDVCAGVVTNTNTFFNNHPCTVYVLLFSRVICMPCLLVDFFKT